ncbi:MAG: tRNA guanosine(34) transglycosylase Tgt [Myxococcota bacterium]|nr:tRNA guanosine(34) transglycosylase Tgt [Myxococcota bacterium]
MRPGFSFSVVGQDGAARAGTLVTPHGTIDTPAFMPVATYGAVRGLAPDELRSAGAQILLANTYHLHERPGEATVATLGGLHGFSGWEGPWLTDSGGFQVTSLADYVKVDEEGVRFRSPLDGRTRLLTPESAMAIQEALGADVAMVLDECQPARPEASDGALRVRAATDRSLRWAERCRAAHRRSDQAVFGIVQGGNDARLRQASARSTAALGFDGYAHGGLGLGEERAARCDMVAATQAELPATAPRYLMGLGKPADLLDGVSAGVDLFDCVLPTRHGRHGVLFTSGGLLRLKNARFREDPDPPDPKCDCPLCARYSRGYLAHLFRSGETLGARLASLHNLRFYLHLLERARAAIRDGRLAALRAEVDAIEAEDAA